MDNSKVITKEEYDGNIEYVKDNHYKKEVEPIDLIEAFELNFNLGNVIKYVSRCEHKGNKKDDLRKALWYLNREMEKVMNKYLIATEEGGTHEMPRIVYDNFEVIKATTKEEAENMYNKKNNTSYFYGVCVAEKVGNTINVFKPSVSYDEISRLDHKYE